MTVRWDSENGAADRLASSQQLGWFGDTSDRYNEHNVCPGESAIQCIDSLLHRQEEYRDRLSHLFRALCRAGHSEVCQITGDMVQAAIELRNALVAIVNLIEERIGTAAAPYGKSSIAARAAKTLLGPKHDVVAVRRQRMEDLMKHGMLTATRTLRLTSTY